MSIVAVPARSDNLPVPASDQAPVVLPTGEPEPGPVPGRPRRGSATIGTMLFITADVMVLAAIVVLLVLAFRTIAGHFSQDRHDSLRAGAVFWQYQSAVWFVVVTVLFLLSRHG